MRIEKQEWQIMSSLEVFYILFRIVFLLFKKKIIFFLMTSKWIRKCQAFKNQFKQNVKPVGFTRAAGAAPRAPPSRWLFSSLNHCRSSLGFHGALQAAEWKGRSFLWNSAYFSSKISWKGCSPQRQARTLPVMTLRRPQVAAGEGFGACT